MIEIQHIPNFKTMFFKKRIELSDWTITIDWKAVVSIFIYSK